MFSPPLPAAFCARASRLPALPPAQEWYTAPTARGLRVNTLKSDEAVLRRALPFALTPVPFSPDGFFAPSDFRAGADALHHAGAYYMQEPSAMAAVTLLAPQPNEYILDLCAAPGGKSTQIAAALKGTGLLWSNEYVRSRATVLLQNLERCGVRNAVVSSMDVMPLCEALEGTFDAVLCDLPCSGEGMFRKEPAALEDWSEETVRLCADRGARILDAAAKAVRVGGRLMISTCTFAPEENEGQVAAFLIRHPEFTLLPLRPDFGQPAFSFDEIASFVSGAPAPAADLTDCRRIFPFHGGEGHFLALLQKTDGAVSPVRPFVQNDRKAADALRTLSEYIRLPRDARLARFGERWHILPERLPRMDGLNVLRGGVPAAEIAKNRLEPTHALFSAYGQEATSVLSLTAADPRVRAFLRGEPISAEGRQGYTAVAVEGVMVGFGKASNGILKNRYPKGLRLVSAD